MPAAVVNATYIFSHLIIAKQVYKSRPYFDHPVIDEEAEKQRRCVN